jgi:hypothetical protein
MPRSVEEAALAITVALGLLLGLSAVVLSWVL